MQKDFLDYIKKHALINNEDSVLLAVSGGLDSTVMTHLFQQSGFTFGIAHCNFRLRGEESDSDEQFVEGLAKRLEVQFHSKGFETGKVSEAQGISTQMAARELRYDWFKELCSQFGYTKIAVAHHKDDNVETLVHNLVRGTSISGLRGMLPQNESVIRPLLGLSRAQIADFATEMNLSWREDSSNETDYYKRNYIRQNIIPKFSELNPNYLEVITDSLGKNREVEQIFKARVAELKSKLIVSVDENSFSIGIEKLKEEGVGPYVLTKLLADFGFNHSQCQDMLTKLDGHVGKQFNASDFTLTIDRKELLISKRESGHLEVQTISESTKTITSISTLFFEKMDANTTVEKYPQKAFLDFDLLQFPLKLRTWQEGDYFVPLGMQGKKKLSDFMIDTKIPLNLKQQQEVVLSGEDIVWVVGKRIDDRYKVTHRTNQIFLITQGKADV